MDTNPGTVPEPDRQALHGFETGKMMQICPDLYSDPQHTISHAHYAVQLCTKQMMHRDYLFLVEKKHNPLIYFSLNYQLPQQGITKSLEPHPH
jgi:hypothetical protein